MDFFASEVAALTIGTKLEKKAIEHQNSSHRIYYYWFTPVIPKLPFEMTQAFEYLGDGSYRDLDQDLCFYCEAIPMEKWDKLGNSRK